MLRILCHTYASNHDVQYNATKSKLMMFPCRTFKMKPACNAGASIFGQHVEYVDEYVYLGHVITPSLNDDNDISRNKRAICVRASMLLRAFCKCTPDVKTIIFNSYCGTVYCAHMWAVYAQYHYTNLIVYYNNAFRRLFGFEKYCSASGMFANLTAASFGEIVRRITYRFLSRICRSNNELILALLRCDSVLVSPLWKRWKHRLL